jgi:fatty acid desaturase
MQLSTREKVVELTLSLPWLVLALYAFDARWWPLALCASFVFFLTGLRQAHGAQHYSLGVPRWAQDLLLLALSVLMLSSLHALQATHMHHHRHVLGKSDLESATARMPWWKAILSGPWFILALNVGGYRMATGVKRTWITLEAALIAGYLVLIFSLGPAALQLFAIAMLIGECLTGFFAVWTVHHDCDPDHQVARTQRGWWKTFLTYQMFYHVEHHLFPAVPAPHLAELAARLDRIAPRLREQQVF